jgi:hypothetical protein
MRKKHSRYSSTRLAAALVAVLLGVLPAALASAQADGESFQILVFALNGPACGGPVVLGEDCPDVLLPGAELVLQRADTQRGAWEDVVEFTTNSSGYASLVVERRGLYQVDVPVDDSGGIRPQPLPFFLAPVRFRVPARQQAEDGIRVTPVVVHFESGIR